jgi:hypothetical protein
MSATRAISLAAACLATTSAFALEQGDYRFNGFGTAAITHLGGDEHVYGIQGQTNDSWRGDQLSKLPKASLGPSRTVGNLNWNGCTSPGRRMTT